MTAPSRAVPTAVALAVLLAAAVPAAAGPLLAPARGRAVATRGIAGERRLVVDRAALADLRRRDTAAVAALPIGRGGAVDVALERFTPFAPDARVEVVDTAGTRTIPLPDEAYFRGTVAGDPTSRVLLIAGRTDVHGWVVVGGEVHAFGPDARGIHRVYALGDVDPAAFPPPAEFCANDLTPEAVAIDDGAPAADVPATADASATLKLADIAIDTDQELRAKFGSDAATLDYLAALAAAATAIYERDVAVRLRFSYIRLWATADPWAATSPGNALQEVRSYWNTAANGMAATAGPRTVVHFVSGKAVQGGVAYVNVLCNASYGYGVSQVYGSFDMASPSRIWDVMVFTHEVGHNFGSPHSHCYSPPLDQCYNAESGCYAGPVVASRGTIMSYCHLLAGGLANIDMWLGATVSDRIGQSVAAATCLATVSSSTTTTSTTTRSSSTTTTTTQPPVVTTTTPSSTTTAPTTSSTTTTTSTTTTSTSTTSTSTTSTTTTTAPRSADGDGDGVPDRRDACPDTPPGDLVDAHGCTLCGCIGPAAGGAWPSRAAYVRCVRAQSRALRSAGALERGALRIAVAAARRSSCGLAAVTRCCLAAGGGRRARCRLLDRDACATRAAAGLAVDVGPGSCTRARCGG
jgi:hypothetical protein